MVYGFILEFGKLKECKIAPMTLFIHHE